MAKSKLPESATGCDDYKTDVNAGYSKVQDDCSAQINMRQTNRDIGGYSEPAKSAKPSKLPAAGGRVGKTTFGATK